MRSLAGRSVKCPVIGSNLLWKENCMRLIASTLVALFILACPVVVEAASSAETAGRDAAMPESMGEFVNWQLDHGACGSWTESGVTQDLWVGIPAGLPYTATETMRYSPDTEQLLVSHHMITSEGRVLSTGADIICWDAARMAPVKSYSGFDSGKPFNGTSILKKMSGDMLVWEYTERSQGKSTVYEQSTEYAATNIRRTSVSLASGEGKPWISRAVRSNPGGDLLKITSLAGTWKESNPGSENEIREINWIAGKHALRQHRILIKDDGSRVTLDLYLMYWDPVHDHIATLYLDGQGTMIQGFVVAVTEEKGVVTVVSSHEGSRFGGLMMSTYMTQVIRESTLTTTFQGMALDGKRHEPSWSESTGVAMRVDAVGG